MLDFEHAAETSKHTLPQHIGAHEGIQANTRFCTILGNVLRKPVNTRPCNTFNVLRGNVLINKQERGGHISVAPPFSHIFTNKNPRDTFSENRKLTTMDRISLTLPYPPTVNHYWQARVVRRGARYVPSVYVGEDGLRYRIAVARILDGAPRFTGRLRVQILVQPPDHRTRDLDNVLKCLLDSLTEAGVWKDDSQVDSLLVVRGGQVDGGQVLVFVEPWEGGEAAKGGGDGE